MRFSPSRAATTSATACRGLLLYDGTRFLQYLEGPASTVDVTMARIIADQRHFAHSVLIEEEISERQFADWDMAYESEQTAGRSLLSQVQERVGSSENRAMKLLLDYAAQGKRAA